MLHFDTFICCTSLLTTRRDSATPAETLRPSRVGWHDVPTAPESRRDSATPAQMAPHVAALGGAASQRQRDSVTPGVGVPHLLPSSAQSGARDSTTPGLGFASFPEPCEASDQEAYSRTTTVQMRKPKAAQIGRTGY